MRLEIHIVMNNAAFHDEVDEAKEDWQGEASRILRLLASRLIFGNFPLTLLDINGNNVGSAKLVEDQATPAGG